MPATGVKILGMREFRRDLRRLGGGMHKGLSAAHKVLATKVAMRAKTRAMGLGSVAAKSAPSIRPSATITRAAVRLGSNRYPFALGAEFGALQYPQFQSWTGNGPDTGYFLYPTIEDMQEEIKDTYLDEVIDKLAERAYPEF